MTEETLPLEARTAPIQFIAPIRLPQPATQYRRRAQRLRTLADKHPMRDYLLFCANLVDDQERCQEELEPASPEDITRHLTRQPPLDVTQLGLPPAWNALVTRFLERQAARTENTQALAQVQALQSLPQDILEQRALALLQGEWEDLDRGQATLLWSSLSVLWSSLASQLPSTTVRALSADRQHCPLCGSPPVGSIILGSDQAGLRYLHCSLCETQWHVVRNTCSHCDSKGKLDYWSLESEEAAIKAESCGDCTTYLKAFYTNREGELEIVADDLASIALDAAVEEKGFFRSGLNPLLFPGQP